jgi:hypothetical protein
MMWQLTIEVSAERAHVVELQTKLEAAHREIERAHRHERSAQAAYEAESAWATLQVKMLTQEHVVRRPQSTPFSPPWPYADHTSPCVLRRQHRAPPRALQFVSALRPRPSGSSR